MIVITYLLDGLTTCIPRKITASASSGEAGIDCQYCHPRLTICRWIAADIDTLSLSHTLTSDPSLTLRSSARKTSRRPESQVFLLRAAFKVSTGTNTHTGLMFNRSRQHFSTRDIQRRFGKHQPSTGVVGRGSWVVGQGIETLNWPSVPNI